MYDFITMSEKELIDYVIEDEGQSNYKFKAIDLNWRYEPNYLLKNLGDFKDWIDWINEEQQVFLEDLEYDRVKAIEDYWLSNPSIEPIILTHDDTNGHDIWDGSHRTGIAFRKGLKYVPVIIGIPR